MVNKRFEDLQAQFGDISTAAQENLSGIRVVKAFAQEQEEVESFRAVCNQYLGGRDASGQAGTGVWPADGGHPGRRDARSCSSSAAFRRCNGQITLGQLVQFVAYLRILSWPLVSLGFVTTVVPVGLGVAQAAAGAVGRPPDDPR